MRQSAVTATSYAIRRPSPAALDRLVTWYRHALNLDLMNEACHALLGEQDFSAFRAASCQAKTPYRCINRCCVERRGRLVVVDIRANAFLHHMVRNIVGSLLAVGAGLQTVQWFENVLLREIGHSLPKPLPLTVFT